MNQKKLIIICLVVFSLIYMAVSFARPNLNVSGVLLGKENSAIINGDIKREGDFIEGAKVVEINENYVRFEYAGDAFIISLGTDVTDNVAEMQFSRKSIQTRNKKEKLSKDLFQINLAGINEKDFVSFITKLAPAVLITILSFVLILGVFFCYCFQVIARKTGTPNGWFAWVPILNIILHCDIAQKPRWWTAVIVLALIIPFVGWIVSLTLFVILWMKTAERRNQPSWFGILILLPLGPLFLYTYLAFFDAHKKQEQPSQEERPVGL